MPTSATGWKYDPSLPAGSRPSASNWAAMYFAANRPPRVAGARPSSRSSARYLRCASIAAVLTAGMGAASVAGGDHRDGDQPFQGHVWLLFMGSLGASHGVNRPAASAVGFASNHERRV